MKYPKSQCIGPHDPCTRAKLAMRFRGMYQLLGLDLAGCAKFLQVTDRTLHNWLSGTHDIPFSAYKLLRVLNRFDLPGPSWDGWFFSGGKLVSPEGRTFDGTDGRWWSLYARRAQMFGELYRENVALKAALRSQQAPGDDGAVLGMRSVPGTGSAAPRASVVKVASTGASVSIVKHARSTARAERPRDPLSIPFPWEVLVTPPKRLTDEPKPNPKGTPEAGTKRRRRAVSEVLS